MNENYFFDSQDYDLLSMINKIIDNSQHPTTEGIGISTSLHPQGIQNLTTTHVGRMAYAVANLLGSLAMSDSYKDRLAALKVLRNEVLHSAQTTFRFNTARVLIQIMKEIVRARGDEFEQLRLIHDFRKVASGNPRIVRKFLTQEYLLEMPEEWNQKTMDDHVHDSSTMGRKNATYLIMDAWVKGIRRLTVVYHNYVETQVAEEILAAAEIMGINVRIGLKFKIVFRGRYIEFLWMPRGFNNAHDFLDFLKRKSIQDFLNEGRETEEWCQRLVYDYLDKYNKVHAEEVAKEYEIEPVTLDRIDFADFLGRGQGTLLRLAEFAHKQTLPELERRANEIKKLLETAPSIQASKLQEKLKKLNDLSPTVFYDKWIQCEVNPDLPSLDVPQGNDKPSFLNISLSQFLERIESLNYNYRLTLLLRKVKEEDFLEILWDSKGQITDVEIFNMKEWRESELTRIKEINEIQSAVNKNNIIVLKNIIQRLLKKPEITEDEERNSKFEFILENIPTLVGYYKKNGLNSRVGTDSTGQLGVRYGMGLAAVDTLPPGAKKIVNHKDPAFQPYTLPIAINLSFIDKYRNKNFSGPVTEFIRNKLGFPTFGLTREREWKGGYDDISIKEPGNLVTLGGMVHVPDNGFMEKEDIQTEGKKKESFEYLKTSYANILKICIGFFPAFITFMLTQDWWFLAWFGAIIWFSVTGFRNIIQMIIAGGVTKGMYVSWKELVNWNRISDSLMYTGISVVLLEGLIRNLLLGHILGITVETMPLLVFTIIAIGNGLYISSHNIFRGFPKTAVVGNLFRSVLAIPVAMVYNTCLQFIIPVITSIPVEAILVPAAAIVTKVASDTVACFIEATADRRNNYRLRRTEYREEILHLFECFTKLELAFPKKNVMKLLNNPIEFNAKTAETKKKLGIETIIISLDLMYFWFYKPCAQQTLISQLRQMTPEERDVFYRFQTVLNDHRKVSELFLDGLLGSEFSKALAFYLDNYKNYLSAMEKIINRLNSPAIPLPVLVANKQEKQNKQ